MKRIIKLLLLVIVLISVMHSADALGITPSRKIIDFEPGLEETITFKILNSELINSVLKIYPRGDLAQYVMIENESIQFLEDQHSVKVSYVISLPDELENPGTNVLKIVIEETPSGADEQVAVVGRLAVIHQLVIQAPLPGTFATLQFTANTPTEGQNVKFNYVFSNEGTEDILGLIGDVEIFNENGESVGVAQYSFDYLKSREKRKDVKVFGTLPVGTYTVKTTVVYNNKKLTAETMFTVIGSYVDIQSISSDNFRLGQINKVDVFIYNNWIRDLQNVFAELTVRDETGNEYGSFKTISVDLAAQSFGNLFGYWETENLPVGTYTLIVTLHYLGSVVEKEFEIQVFPTEIQTSSLYISGSATVTERSTKSPVPMLLLVFIVLIVVNIYLIYKVRKKKNPPSFENYKTQMIILICAVMLEVVKIF